MILHLSNDVLNKLVGDAGFSSHVTPGVIRLAGIRGAVPCGADQVSLDDNRPNVYNDSLIIWGSRFLVLPGTTDPGICEAPNPAGLARLMSIGDDPKGVPITFVKGLHHGDPANPCLVTLGGIPCRRDGGVLSLAYGIHLHKMGWETGPIGNWSEGCQGIPREHWAAFWSIIEQADQAQFEYFLFNSRWAAGKLGVS